MKKIYLFLQGVCSPFFEKLGEELRRRGHQVCKVNYTVGDAASWRIGSAFPCNEILSDLPDFYASLFSKIKCTDIVLFGDQRPVHASAVALARKLGVRVHVFEEGYFRPYWITLERDGVNANSQLPSDPDWFMEKSSGVPHYDNGKSFHSSFFVRALHDVLYHSAGSFNWIYYPNYRTHSLCNAFVEYSSYIRKAFRMVFNRSVDTFCIDALLERKAPFYLLPLQLDGDSQIRCHSSFKNMAEVIFTVVKSFALFASSHDHLVVKNHPLDIGLVDYRSVLRSSAKQFGVEHRVIFLDAAHLPTLLVNCRGVVTVNSTVGSSALVHRRKVIALGKSIYGLAGLTFQGRLDEFWSTDFLPNMRLFRAFRQVVIHATQINGGFYTNQGIELAVTNCLEALISDKSPLQRMLGTSAR